MLFMLADLSITGELDMGEYDHPSGAHSRIFGCARCKARIYATNDSREGMASLRCGTLANSESARKSVVEGKSVSVLVDIGGRRFINKKTYDSISLTHRRHDIQIHNCK